MSTRRLQYTPACALRFSPGGKVQSLAISPDGLEVVACITIGDDVSTTVAFWRLPSATVSLTMTTPYLFHTVMWPLDRVGPAFLAANGLIMLLPPKKPGFVKVALVKLDLEAVIAADFCTFTPVDPSLPVDHHLMAVASSARISIFSLASDGEDYSDYKHFSHAESAVPVRISWAVKPPGDLKHALWTAYRDGSIIMNDADTGQVITRLHAANRAPITWASFSRSKLTALDEAGCIWITHTVGRRTSRNPLSQNASYAVSILDGKALVHGEGNALVSLSDTTTGDTIVAFREPGGKSVFAAASHSADAPILCTAAHTAHGSAVTVWRIIDLDDEHLVPLMAYLKLWSVGFWVGAVFAMVLVCSVVYWLGTGSANNFLDVLLHRRAA